MKPVHWLCDSRTIALIHFDNPAISCLTAHFALPLEHFPKSSPLCASNKISQRPRIDMGQIAKSDSNDVQHKRSVRSRLSYELENAMRRVFECLWRITRNGWSSEYVKYFEVIRSCLLYPKRVHMGRSITLDDAKRISDWRKGSGGDPSERRECSLVDLSLRSTNAISLKLDHPHEHELEVSSRGLEAKYGPGWGFDIEWDNARWRLMIARLPLHQSSSSTKTGTFWGFHDRKRKRNPV